MNIPVEIPGLNTLIPEVAEGRLVVVEGGTDAAKSFFVRRIALTALRGSWPVTFVISRDRLELLGLLATEGGSPGPDGQLTIVEKESIHSLDEFATKSGLLVVDSFSFLTLELPAVELAHMLRHLRELCQTHGLSVLLAIDRGMMASHAEAVTAHMSDGLLQFHTQEGPEGVFRFLRISKWTGVGLVEKNIYYEFDGKRLAIDLRNRVI